MIKKRILFLVLCLLSALFLPAQLSKGDRYYERSEYIRAIPYYEKEVRSKNSARKQEALVKLGNSYRLINDYVKAEDAYRRALELGENADAMVHYQYAQALKVNGKYEEAAEQYAKYIQRSPNDENAKNALKFCREIKYYLSKPVEYAVKNIGSINSAYSEFSPFVMDGKLMFVAERESFDFVNYNVNNHNGEPYLNMYVSALEGAEVRKSKSFSKKLNTDYHEGPGCVSSDGSTLYFTRVDPHVKKGRLNHARIFTATGSSRNWKNVQALPLNSEEYSNAHPAISADNNTLYFTSNRPGGYGGKDIWMSKRSGDTWSEPVNLGPDINTSGDEMFPSVKKDGTLYFASNGLPGFGGLDIYSARNVDGKWILQRNEGLHINSSADDFGMAFLNDSMGYFSSNRTGGKGKDDIYVYEYSDKSMVISGTVLLTENLKDYAKDKKVVLLDENGKAVDSTRTNNKGYFEFKNLDAEKKYLAVIAEEDPSFTGKARYYLTENDSVIQRVTGKYGDKRFAFKNLPVDPNGLPDLYTEDDLVFAGTLMSGEKGTVPMKNAKLRLVNDYGDVVEETTTNEFGAFAFRNIPSDQNYLISVDEGDVSLPEGTRITLTNRSGKEIKSFNKTRGKFTFKVLNTDKAVLQEMDAEDVNLVMGIYGYMYDQDKKPVVNAKIKVKNPDGSNEQEFVTTAKGKFSFKNLEAEKDYLFEADENDPALSGVKRLFIADNKGSIYKVIELLSGKFSFKILEVDKAALGEFVVDDPWLKVTEMKRKQKQAEEKKELAKAEEKKDKPVKPVKEEPEEDDKELTLVIVENIYYAYGDHQIGPDGERVLNKAAEALLDNPKLIMEISSHTDSHSSAAYNMNLSNKRAQTAVDYLVKKGVSRSRLVAKGYGESKLLNHCSDNIPCTEEEHKINRRTEFKITKPKKK